ncbi:Tyrosine--tRNA ligase, mitochondrial [Tolypocladium ophioglossoides CBS 100239]|uniref:Tyrosine--tRNA ligase n=1 Tax=Tolypocladium ophioglossoides (strain CBS 100239) TaxID=1163406 RepID=A0A0L0NBJ5_TOLOC|nr:Tyrosine--tRNA ligase, mitochondrial [Tolypocladium ophioglossoides CBS 100239]
MAPRVTIGSLAQAGPRASPRCASRQSPWSLAELHRARSIAQSYLKKVADGEERWENRAQRIQNGEERHVWDLLDERGYIKDVAGYVGAGRLMHSGTEIMRIKRIGAYVGVDPTADSLHIGHLLPFMPLFWMWFHGYPAVTLLGGATARIGDPTGRLQSREHISNSDISKNITKLHYQLSKLWRNVITLRDKYGYEKDWAAKHHLLNNNIVKRKMTEGDGMSLGEFMYPLFQGWDFWHMYNKLGIQMQIGGSDQFGNIVAGMDALKIIRDTEEAPYAKMPTAWQHEPMGFTVPLLTDSAGVKFGKSTGNAVWLDEFKTSAFELYGYFMRRSDDEVEKLLMLFTFMPMSKVQEVMVQHRADPAKRVAQHTLAVEVLSLVHGSQKALQEAQQHKFRFGGELPHVINEPSEESGIITPNNAPRSDIQLPRSVMKMSPAKLLFATGLASSNTDGQRLVTQQGAYVAAQPGQSRGLVPGNLSWTPMKMWFPEETAKYLIDDRILILRKGKHNVRIVELISDEEWEKSGKFYPGQPYTGVVRRMKEQLKKDAEGKGEELSPDQLSKALKETQTLKVANNPDIELPNKQEVRERVRERKDASKSKQ